MTREEILRSMKGPELIKEADKLGVKVKCDKARKKLVEAKAALVDRILAFEAEQQVEEVVEEIPANTLVETPAPEKITAYVEAEDQQEITLEVEEITPPTPKRGALIEWNGKAQNICAWADELGISANTLYGRIYKLGWTVERAFTTKGRR